MTYALNDWKDGVGFTGAVSANTVGPFTLLGGLYMVGVTAPSTSATLNIQMPDGSYIAVGTSTTFGTSGGTAVVSLPASTYQIVLVATGNVAGFVTKIPYRAA